MALHWGGHAPLAAGRHRRVTTLRVPGLAGHPRQAALCAALSRDGACGQRILKDESRPMGGFIPTETLVLAGTAGDNGTAGATLNQRVPGFLVG